MTDLVFRLQERARIRRQIPGRKSVEEGTPDRIADLLEEAAKEIEQLRSKVNQPLEQLRSIMNHPLDVDGSRIKDLGKTSGAR